MWSTLVVASLYAGVALSAPIEQHNDAEETAAQYPNWFGDRDGDGYGDGDDMWGRGKPWGSGLPNRFPTAYSAPQAGRRPASPPWLGYGPRKNDAPFFIPAKPTCSSRPRGFMDYFLGGERGKKGGCESEISKPEPWKAPSIGPPKGYGGRAPPRLGGPEGLDDLDEDDSYGQGDSGIRGSQGGIGGMYPYNDAPNPMVGLLPPSSAAPLATASSLPEPSSALAPVPVPKTIPSAAAPNPELSAKPSGNRVPTLGASPAKDLPVPQSPVPAPVPQSIAPAPTAQAPRPAPISQGEPPIVNHGLWQPQVAEPFQIILSGHPDVTVKLAPDFVNIFDLDLFNTPVSTIRRLRDQGKKVICYFSAGSSEDWRPDFKQLSKSDMGNKIAKSDDGKDFWEGERWLNIKNPNPDSDSLPPVWQVMRDRIKLAAEKGCNAVDPDNTGK
jgi:hypothetical protein